MEIIEVSSSSRVVKGPNGVNPEDVRVKYFDGSKVMTLKEHWIDQDKRAAKKIKEKASV